MIVRGDDVVMVRFVSLPVSVLYPEASPAFGRRANRSLIFCGMQRLATFIHHIVRLVVFKDALHSTHSTHRRGLSMRRSSAKQHLCQ